MNIVLNNQIKIDKLTCKYFLKININFYFKNNLIRNILVN